VQVKVLQRDGVHFGAYLSPEVAAAGLVAEQVTAEAQAAIEASGTKDPERPPAGRGQWGMRSQTR
jgi:hypothetical protein